NQCPVVGDNQCLVVGDNQCPVVGDNQCLVVGDNQCPVVGDNQCPVVGDNQCPVVGDNQCPVVGDNQCQRQWPSAPAAEAESFHENISLLRTQQDFTRPLRCRSLTRPRSARIRQNRSPRL